MSQFKFVNSNRGKAGIIFQNYFYTERKTLRSCEVIFMCPKKTVMPQYKLTKIEERC